MAVERTTSRAASTEKPVFGIVLVGGALSGALVRDIRLANELVKRGFPVHCWWAVARTRDSGLDPAIPQHWLFGGMRFTPPQGSPGLVHRAYDRAGRLINAAFSDRSRAHYVQRHPNVLKRAMEGLMHALCDGVDAAKHRDVVRTFARHMHAAGVTHMLPMLEMIGPWIDAARAQHPKLVGDVKNLITFQGYELYSMYARSIGRERELYRRLVETVVRSDFPAIAVSADYALRVTEEVGVPSTSMVAIPPGVPTVPASARLPQDEAQRIVKERFSEYQQGLPLVTYLGRQDAEKGIDLLLYAAAILRRRGLKFQVAVCGPTLWGKHYSEVCRQIAQELRCPVLWRRFVPDDVRSALFTVSRCIVYPSIHREPFGMVPVEALARGVPAIVPEYGGVAGTVEANGCMGGLRFRAWDSGHLAAQLEALLLNDRLHAELAAAGPHVAEYFSVEKLADRVLAHMELPVKA